VIENVKILTNKHAEKLQKAIFQVIKNMIKKLTFEELLHKRKNIYDAKTAKKFSVSVILK